MLSCIISSHHCSTSWTITRNRLNLVPICDVSIVMLELRYTEHKVTLTTIYGVNRSRIFNCHHLIRIYRLMLLPFLIARCRSAIRTVDKVCESRVCLPLDIVVKLTISVNADRACNHVERVNVAVCPGRCFAQLGYRSTALLVANHRRSQPLRRSAGSS